MTRGRGIPWLVLVATVVLGALAQGLTAMPGYAGPTPLFWIVSAGSLVMLVAQVAAMTWAAVRIASPAVKPHLGRVAIAAVIVVMVGIGLALVSLLTLPLTAVAASCALPAAGRRTGAPFAVFRRHPVRAIVATVVTLVVAVPTWLVAFASGLFLTGVVGGVAMWLWFGAIGALLLVWWARLQVRPTR